MNFISVKVVYFEFEFDFIFKNHRQFKVIYENRSPSAWLSLCINHFSYFLSLLQTESLPILEKKVVQPIFDSIIGLRISLFLLASRRFPPIIPLCPAIKHTDAPWFVCAVLLRFSRRFVSFFANLKFKTVQFALLAIFSFFFRFFILFSCRNSTESTRID